jgi:beta-glucosidase
VGRSTRSAILEAWYGTQGGNAVANLLFGDAIPQASFPSAWPVTSASFASVRAQHDAISGKSGKRYWGEESRSIRSDTASAIPFRFSNLKLDRAEIKPGETIHASVDVENTGAATADEVADLHSSTIWQHLASRPRAEGLLARHARLARKKYLPLFSWK